MTTVTVSLSDEEIRRLEELSKCEGLTVEQIVRLSVCDFIGQLDESASFQSRYGHSHHRVWRRTASSLNYSGNPKANFTARSTAVSFSGDKTVIRSLNVFLGMVVMVSRFATHGFGNPSATPSTTSVGI